MIERVERKYDSIVFLMLIAVVAVALNYPGYLVAKTALVHRVADPILLLIGLIGSVLQIRALRMLGWLAIAWFYPVILFSVPNFDHMDTTFMGFPAFWRLATILILSAALVVSYKRLACGK